MRITSKYLNIPEFHANRWQFHFVHPFQVQITLPVGFFNGQRISIRGGRNLWPMARTLPFPRSLNKISGQKSWNPHYYRRIKKEYFPFSDSWLTESLFFVGRTHRPVYRIIISIMRRSNLFPCFFRYLGLSTATVIHRLVVHVVRWHITEVGLLKPCRVASASARPHEYRLI